MQASDSFLHRSEVRALTSCWVDPLFLFEFARVEKGWGTDMGETAEETKEH